MNKTKVIKIACIVGSAVCFWLSGYCFGGAMERGKIKKELDALVEKLEKEKEDICGNCEEEVNE